MTHIELPLLVIESDDMYTQDHHQNRVKVRVENGKIEEIIWFG